MLTTAVAYGIVQGNTFNGPAALVAPRARTQGASPMPTEDPNRSTYDLIVDRVRHGIVFAEATERCLRELLALIEGEKADET